jgi:hypothetical protein
LWCFVDGSAAVLGNGGGPSRASQFETGGGAAGQRGPWRPLPGRAIRIGDKSGWRHRNSCGAGGGTRFRSLSSSRMTAVTRRRGRMAGVR